MGIDIDSSVMIGERVGDIDNLKNQGDVLEWADDNELCYASPYYDCYSEDYIIGFSLSSSDIDSEDILDKIKTWKEKFKSITGCDARIIITPDVW